MPTNRQKAANGSCKAKTKAGGPCAAPAIRGGQFCAIHSDPERAAQLGRKGGRGNRHLYENDGREVAAPQTALDVKNLLAEVMAEVRAGAMDPKLGTTLGYLGTSLLRAIEMADADERLKRVENDLACLAQESPQPNVDLTLPERMERRIIINVVDSRD